MVVVDSSVWIDFFNGAVSPARDALRQLLSKGEVEVCVPDLVLYEVLRGFRQEQNFRDARRLMRSLTIADTGGDRQRAHQAAGIAKVLFLSKAPQHFVEDEIGNTDFNLALRKQLAQRVAGRADRSIEEVDPDAGVDD